MRIDLTVVQIVLIILKLTGVVTWSWWAIMAPSILAGVILMAVLGAVLALGIMAALVELTS